MPIFKAPNNQPVVAKLPPMLENLPVHRVVFSGNNFVRLAGLSGAAAVILGAYGAHSKILTCHGYLSRSFFSGSIYYPFITIIVISCPDYCNFF